MLEILPSTAWIVLTGTACSGKTTLLNALAERGFPTAEEAARIYFAQEASRGRSIEDLSRDRAGIQDGIWAVRASIEQRLDPAELTFLDRALPDSLAYSRFNGHQQEREPLFNYRAVFILDRLPFVQDGGRLDDDRTAAAFEPVLWETYRELGYDPIQVPVCSIEERVALVLDHLGV